MKNKKKIFTISGIALGAAIVGTIGVAVLVQQRTTRNILAIEELNSETIDALTDLVTDGINDN